MSEEINSPVNYTEEIKVDRQAIINYIQACHLSDGGYFFAKVAPSSGLETYLAVRALQLLGAQPKDKKSIALFWQRHDKEGNLDSPFAIYLAVKSYQILGFNLESFQKYSDYLTRYYQVIMSQGASVYLENKQWGVKSFSLAMSYIGTVGRELESLFYLTQLQKALGLAIIKEREVAQLVNSLQNQDGGFGRGGDSHLMTTYHALSILKLLSARPAKPDKIYRYLIGQLPSLYFLEDLFYLVQSFALIGKPVPQVRKIVQFVASCQKNNGGFGRASSMSIATIEDTYYAVSIIKTAETSSRQKFIF